MGWKLSCQALMAPVLVPVVTAANSPPTAAPKRDLLAFHVAERLVDARREERVAAASPCIAMTGAHGQDQRPWRRRSPSPGAGCRHTGRTCTSGRTRISRSRNISTVGEPGGVLERVGRVGVEEAAAVVAQLLDPLLRGDRADGDVLDGALERGDDRGGVRTSAARPARPGRARRRSRSAAGCRGCRASGRPSSCRASWRCGGSGRGPGRSRPRGPSAAEVKLRTARPPTWVR